MKINERKIISSRFLERGQGESMKEWEKLQGSLRYRFIQL